LSVLIAAITFLVTWHARKLTGRVPPVITGIAVGTGLYYFVQAVGLGAHLGPVIGSEPLAGIGLTALPYFSDLARVDEISHCSNPGRCTCFGRRRINGRIALRKLVTPSASAL
jgi:hypothetical protein